MEITRESIRDNVFKPFHNQPTMTLVSRQLHSTCPSQLLKLSIWNRPNSQNLRWLMPSNVKRGKKPELRKRREHMKNWRRKASRTMRYDAEMRMFSATFFLLWTCLWQKLVDEAAYKDRAWDDWKDDNPRGCGITKKYWTMLLRSRTAFHAGRHCCGALIWVHNKNKKDLILKRWSWSGCRTMAPNSVLVVVSQKTT